MPQLEHSPGGAQAADDLNHPEFNTALTEAARRVRSTRRAMAGSVVLASASGAMVLLGGGGHYVWLQMLGFGVSLACLMAVYVLWEFPACQWCEAAPQGDIHEPCPRCGSHLDPTTSTVVAFGSESARQAHASLIALDAAGLVQSTPQILEHDAAAHRRSVIRLAALLGTMPVAAIGTLLLYAGLNGSLNAVGESGFVEHLFVFLVVVGGMVGAITVVDNETPTTCRVCGSRGRLHTPCKHCGTQSRQAALIAEALAHDPGWISRDYGSTSSEDQVADAPTAASHMDSS